MEIFMIVLQVIGVLILGFIAFNNIALYFLSSKFDQIENPRIQQSIVDTVEVWAKYNFNKRFFTTTFIMAVLFGSGGAALWFTTAMVTLPIMSLIASVTMILADKRLLQIVDMMKEEGYDGSS